jgi:lipopolysaccharide biosynthesis protein
MFSRLHKIKMTFKVQQQARDTISIKILTAAELREESIKNKIKHKLNQSIQYLILFN